uniref:Protein FAM221A n=1 Tax=Neospora caninum (strain Liverpool) TaxID=572307 RepID=A0A0F7UAZ8_NEOCL|nr:TPA: Uncharacterized protein C7orf46 homolog [Neospora caninum Liverpool]
MSNRFSPQDPRHVEAYLEYRTIVGDTDNGTLLSRQEYDAVRERAAAASRNPLRVFWRNNVSGVDCRNVGPSSLCLCGHRLRDHDWMATETKAVKCRMQACKCRLFEFIPVHGSQDVKCRCKHSYADHDVLSRKCTRCAPRQAPPFHRTQRLSKPKQAASALCTGFMPSYTCSCGSAFAAHETVFETTSERREQGAPAVAGATGTDGDSLAFMGGLSDFTSLLDGVNRMSLSCADPLRRLWDSHAGATQAAAGTNASLSCEKRGARESNVHLRTEGSNENDDVLYLLFRPCLFKTPAAGTRA